MKRLPVRENPVAYMSVGTGVMEAVQPRQVEERALLAHLALVVVTLLLTW